MEPNSDSVQLALAGSEILHGIDAILRCGCYCPDSPLELASIMPPGKDSIGLALGSLFVAEVIEEILSWALARWGWRVHPEAPNFSDEEIAPLITRKLQEPSANISSSVLLIVVT